MVGLALSATGAALPLRVNLLVAAAGMQTDDAAATEALVTVLRLRPDFSLTWVRGNTPLTGEIAERVIEGLRRAGVPEG
jgi:hypothetical protein